MSDEKPKPTPRPPRDPSNVEGKALDSVRPDSRPPRDPSYRRSAKTNAKTESSAGPDICVPGHSVSVRAYRSLH